MIEKGYKRNELWKLWIGDLIGILSGYVIFISTSDPLEVLLLKLFLLLVMMLTYSTDIRDQFILNIYTYPAIAVFLICRFFIHENDYSTLVYMIGGFGIYLLLITVMFIMIGKFGGGDLKLFVALGFYFGVYDILLLLFISSILGLIYGGYQYLKYKESRPYAFGPFIVLGVLIILATKISYLDLLYII